MTDFKVAIIMGSRSDLDAMQEAATVLQEFGIDYEMRALSAHRTPAAVQEYVSSLADRGFAAVIAGAGGAAHLAGVCASHTHLPVFGVPMRTSLAGGLDSLLSTVQMPRGIPVATTATGGAGAYNAALLAVAMISLSDTQLRAKYIAFRTAQTQKVLDQSVIEH
ncbi:MAG: 5-(carboxyamino)imidazole ribonucleotide mutase [Arcanobacterium sp.]|nr:5-(carboxyamino)imidazole ribonucleotide mutase [Arcanobacterium sp.]MDY5589689.1 5-(carboxyamino)imidazole ribonucleotide mutase [Arcanobacterium sp.]